MSTTGEGTVQGDEQEQERERVLAAYDVVGGPPRRELETLVDLAAQVAGVPFAAINLFSTAVQHQVATVGFEGEDTSREDSMCRLVVESGHPIMVEDAGADARFADSPWTTGQVADPGRR